LRIDRLQGSRDAEAEIDDASIAEVIGAAEDVSRKAHLAFLADSRKQVDEYYQTALAAGGQSNGAPGLREHGPKYYAAYVLDFEGNNMEVVFQQKSATVLRNARPLSSRLPSEEIPPRPVCKNDYTPDDR
jgi:hypothetical protein